MSQSDVKEDILKAQYQELSDFELKQAFHKIRKNHSKENMIEDLMQMNAVMEIMKERNIPVPVASERIRAQSAETEKGPNYAGAGLGLVICLVGLGLTIASSGQTIFYGAILVGFVLMIKNMIPS